MKRATAAVFEGLAGQIELREFPVPEPLGGETLVRVVGCTLCGSDLHTFEGRRTVPCPTILGHEIVGEVVQLGDAAPTTDATGQPLRCGDRVTWAIVAHCGECFYCRRDLPQKCVRAVKYGHEMLRSDRDLYGGLADYCLLAPGTTLVRLPDELSLAAACPASCATATIAAALEAAGDLHGGTVGVLGAGMLGLTACAMSRSRGATDVHCFDPVAERLQLAERFGATARHCRANFPPSRPGTHSRGASTSCWNFRAIRPLSKRHGHSSAWAER